MAQIKQQSERNTNSPNKAQGKSKTQKTESNEILGDVVEMEDGMGKTMTLGIFPTFKNDMMAQVRNIVQTSIRDGLSSGVTEMKDIVENGRKESKAERRKCGRIWRKIYQRSERCGRCWKANFKMSQQKLNT